MDLTALGRSPLFAEIGEAELAELLSCLRARELHAAKNQVILRAGEPAGRVGLVLRGGVQVMREDVDGKRSVVAAVEPPELFAEVFACAGVAELPVSVVAGEESEVLLLDCAHLLTPCANGCTAHRQLIRNLLRVVARKTLLMNRKLELLARRTTREKLLAYLGEECRRAGSRFFTIPYDRQGLADYLGVERSAMSAELGKLRREGRIDFQKNHFKLL